MHDRQNRSTELRLRQRVTTIELGAEYRLRLVNLARHAGVLRTLTGEEEGDAWLFVAVDESRDDVGRCATFCDRTEASGEIGSGLGNDRGAVAEMRTAGVEREGRVGRAQRWIGVEHA